MEMEYWAAKGEEFIPKEIMAKVEYYQDYVKNSGLLVELQKSYDTFFGKVQIEDVDEALKAIHINHFASYVRNIHNMVTASRPAWEPQAINTDLESQADTTLASGLLDYYMREKRIEMKLTSSVLRALFLKEGWISLGWNATGGEIYGMNPETQEPIKEGDFKVGTHSLLDIARDVDRKDMDHIWYVVREFENKWDIAARHPEYKQKIITLSMSMEDKLSYELGGYKKIAVKKEAISDLIPIYTLFHARTDALPSGRMTTVLNADIPALFDGALPYKDIYCFPITTGDHFETGFGYSYLMDLLPVQDAFDMTVSAILTNQAANAVQNFQVPKGAAPAVTVMSGMNVWEYDSKAGPIAPLELLKTAPEVFNFGQFLISQGDLISNVSQIGRGNAPANMSGTAMALLQQQAIQSTSGVQTSYTLAIENIGTALIQLLQTFAVVPRVALIAGKSKRSMMRTFSNKDLGGIGRVFVNRANPLTKTGAGRMEIANNLLNAPPPQPGSLIKTPEQYLGVLTTGSLEPLYQHENSQRLLIVSENEQLMDGQEVQGVITDDDATHILEHECVLNSQEARANPKVVSSTINHIQWHIDNAKSKPPELAAMLKQQSFFQPPPVPMGPPQEGGPGPQMPAGGPGQIPQMDNQNPVTGEGAQVGLPEPAQPPNPNAFNQGA